MNEVLAKAKIALAVDRSPERARSVALRMVELASAVLNRGGGMDNYAVQVNVGKQWAELQTGTKEWCIGFAEGYGFRTPGSYRVVCGQTVIWPDDQYLDDVDDSNA